MTSMFIDAENNQVKITKKELRKAHLFLDELGVPRNECLMNQEETLTMVFWTLKERIQIALNMACTADYPSLADRESSMPRGPDRSL